MVGFDTELPISGKKLICFEFVSRPKSRINHACRDGVLRNPVQRCAPFLAIVFHSLEDEYTFSVSDGFREPVPRVRGKVPKETFTAKLTTNPGHSYSH